MIFILAGAAVILTYGVFHTRSMLLGFPAGIMWFLLGGMCYTLSTALWDIEYFLFFAAMFLGIFVIYAAYTVNRRDLKPAKEDWDDSDKYVDEKDKDVSPEAAALREAEKDSYIGDDDQSTDSQKRSSERLKRIQEKGRERRIFKRANWR